MIFLRLNNLQTICKCLSFCEGYYDCNCNAIFMQIAVHFYVKRTEVLTRYNKIYITNDV
jgi:hypothetical protein